MGTTFNSFQIQTGEHKTLEQVKNTLLQYFKKKGLVLADEDTASDTYLLALSENGKWLTVSRPEYDTDMQIIKKDRFDFLEAFKTCCIETSVVDSDMLILNLADYKTEQEDSIMIGADTYGMEDKTGKRGLWEPLLKDGVTWDQLQEILCGEYIFVEEILLKIAPLLGIDENFATSDYSSLDSIENDNPNMMMLYLKSSKPKPKSLNTVFKEVFGEALEPLGFKKIKGRQPYFVRVVEGGEIIHVIGMKKIDDYNFDIVAGIATVYRPKIDLSVSPRMNTNWLRGVSEFYKYLNRYDFDNEYRKSIMYFGFGQINDKLMLEVFRFSLDLTKKWILPIMEKANSISTTLDCLYKLNYFDMLIYSPNDNFKKWNIDNEGLLVFLLDNPYEMVEKRYRETMKRNLYETEHNLNGHKLENFNEHCDNIHKNIEQNKEKIGNILKNQINFEKTLEELKQRKIVNTEILRSYGLEI